MDAAILNSSSFTTTCDKRSYSGIYKRGVVSKFILSYNSRCKNKYNKSLWSDPFSSETVQSRSFSTQGCPFCPCNLKCNRPLWSGPSLVPVQSRSFSAQSCPYNRHLLSSSSLVSGHSGSFSARGCVFCTYNLRGGLRNGICLCVKGGNGEFKNVQDSYRSCLKVSFLHFLLKKGVILVGLICGVFVIGCRRVLAVEGVISGGYGVLEQGLVVLRSYWPTVLLVLRMFKEQGLILAALLGLSAFFSMAETSITTLWPWKVRELAEKESDNEGVFKMLRSDVTRFLTTILIGTTVVNIAATALVTEAATAAFGEAGVSAATGVMTVAILLLTEITPKSIAVHNATEVARFVVRPVAWLSLILYPVGRVVTYLSMGMLKLLGLKGRSEPYVTEDELKLMLRGAELSGAIEEEEQDMIENVLEIKDTHVREVMTPLVDVVAIDASATLVDFHTLWVTHQYSRVPVFEQRIDNIVGIAYAMDLLDYVQKGELLESSIVGDMAHKPAYFVPDSMSVWNLLREFRIRKVHMAVVLNEYGGTIGIVTLEDVVEEIVGEIFDENDSKEEIQKKTGYIVMRAEGIYDVDANTSIDQLSEDLNIKMPEGHQYETVSGFVCEAFGYIPRTGETIKLILERGNEDEDSNYNGTESDRADQNEKNQTFKLEILAGNARKVSAVRFERISDDVEIDTNEVTRLVPKIMTRKWKSNGGADRNNHDGISFMEGRDEDEDDSNNFVMAEREDSHDVSNKQ